MNKYIVLFFVFASWGCADSTGSPPDQGFDLSEPHPADMASDASGTELTGQIGIGEPLIPFTTGQEVELVSGFQGGWHVDAYFLLEEVVDESSLEAEIQVIGRIDGVVEDVMFSTQFVDSSYWESEDAGWVCKMSPLVLNTFEYPEDWLGKSVELKLEMTLADGRVARGSVQIVLKDEVEEAEFG